METSRGNIFEEIEHSMLYDDKLKLLSNTRKFKDSLFHIFSVIVTIWANFLGLNYKHT